MLLRFTKMHGLGNDFMVIDLISQRAHIQSDHIQQWSDRHTGIGFDQLLLIEPPTQPEMDFRYRIFNASGGEVEQCGNGARCFARFVQDKRLTNKKVIKVETCNSYIELRVLNNDQVLVDMGRPQLSPAKIPFITDTKALAYPVETDGQVYELTCLSMGNPHAVLRVQKVDNAPVHDLGPRLEQHKQFPKRANIGFLQVLDQHHAKLRVWERGIGETRACGTGACAAAVAGICHGWLQSPVSIQLLGGQLTIEWGGPNETVKMTGPATYVYEGQIKL